MDNNKVTSLEGLQRYVPTIAGTRGDEYAAMEVEESGKYFKVADVERLLATMAAATDNTRAQSATDDLPKFDRSTAPNELAVIELTAKFSAPRQFGREFSESGLMSFVDALRQPLAADVRDRALEEAAKICERVSACSPEGCAYEIRALKSQRQASQGGK